MEMKVTGSIQYVGVNDNEIRLFEGQYPVPNGMAYNSYLILDEKVAVMDSVEAEFGEEWIRNIREKAGDRTVDYLVVQHLEPDHSGSIARIYEAYPDVTIVSNAKAFQMMDQFYPGRIGDRRITVKNGEKLSLGSHELNFVFAPMVHWPEVMMTYESSEKVLFAADAFGKFGSNAVDEPWTDEARRYYIGIVGKFGPQVTKVLGAASKLDIQIICSLHGPVLSADLGKYIGRYQTWASYQPESRGVVIAFNSVYGNTAAAADLLAEELKKTGCTEVVLHDLEREDVSYAVADAFRYDRLVLAATTYNGDVFPAMREFIEHLTARNFQNRTVGFIENGSWAPMATKVMQKLLEGSKKLTYLENGATVKSALSETSRTQICAMAEELAGK